MNPNAAAAAASGVRARFFKSPVGDCVELTLAGDPFQTNVMHRVTPEHIDRFPLEWDAYSRSLPQVEYGGTPLIDVPGVELDMVTSYSLIGVHNAEQLAAIADGGLMSLGTGGRAVRDAARQLLALNDAKAKQDAADADRQRLADLEAKSAEADATTAERDKRIAELEAMLADAKSAPQAKGKAKPAEGEQA